MPWVRAAAVCAVVVVADQASKALVRAHVEVGSHDGVLPAVELVHVRNEGVAFGALRGRRPAGGGGDRHRPGGAAGLLRDAPEPPARLAADRHAASAARSGTSSTACASARSPTSSSCRRGRRSTSPTCRSRSACSCCCTSSKALRPVSAMELRAGPEHDGARLDALLAGPLGSRARAQRLIEAGRVQVDGGRRAQAPPGARGRADRRRRAARATAGAGARRALRRSLRGRRPARGRQAGRASSCTPPAATRRDAGPGAGGVAGGGDDAARAGIVHRLDRDTSGLLVVAKHESVHRALRERPAEARDHARVPRARRGPAAGADGHDRRADRPRPPRPHAPCRPTPTTRTWRSPTSRSSGRCRATTLLRVRLETGRTHQIRAHLLAIGHPVAGDPDYGTAGLLGLERQFLHAARLAFAHPVTGAPVDVSSPLPPDLAAALERAAAG